MRLAGAFLSGRFFAYALNDVREGLTFERGCRAGEVDDQWVHVNKKKKRPVERSAKHLLKCYGTFFVIYLAQVSRPVAAGLLGYEFMCSIRAMSGATIPFPIRLLFSFHHREILRLRSE